MTPPTSLRARLLVASLAWIVVALGLTGLVLMVLFRLQMERRFDIALSDQLQEIAAAARIGEDGRLQLSWEPADPRFRTPVSGWYWEVRAGARPLHRSPSLGEATLPIESPGPGPNLIRDIYWPRDECLRVIVQEIGISSSSEPLTVVVAGPRREIRTDVGSFARLIVLALGTLALVLGTLTLVQVSYGLRPLSNLRQDLTDLRRGGRARMSVAAWPREVEPLVHEINALLTEREEKLERARAEAGNLAHALKTPIAIIANEAARMNGPAAETLKSETLRMQRVLEHHLVRARAAAGYRSADTSAPVAPVLDDVLFSLGKLHPELALGMDADNAAAFAGDGDDLGEMIGNLADNAAKWAMSHVAIAAAVDGDRLAIAVEDDGPGLDEASCAAAIKRGERLDSGALDDTNGARGHGLGLPIVGHLAELYGGRLSLDRSPLGGLRARLDLPAAKAREPGHGGGAASTETACRVSSPI